MSPPTYSTPSLLFPPPLVCVIDTSVLIAFKKLVKIDDQWGVLLGMSQLVRDGALTFPKQVVQELAYGEHPDAPGAWIGNAKGDVRYPQPSEETLVKVLGVAAELVDTEASDEVADPYVAGMASEIAAEYGCRVVVATDDRVDRLPAKLSLVTACGRLGIECWSTERLIEWLAEAE